MVVKIKQGPNGKVWFSSDWRGREEGAPGTRDDSAGSAWGQRLL